MRTPVNEAQIGREQKKVKESKLSTENKKENKKTDTQWFPEKRTPTRKQERRKTNQKNRACTKRNYKVM